MLKPLDVDDLPAAHQLLCEGFPARSAAFWQLAVSRVRAQAANDPVAGPWGHGLYDRGHLVGLALTPTSVRRAADGQVLKLVNLSSWTIRPSHRWRAVFMLRHLLSDPHATYIDLTPTPAVRQMLPHFGLAAVNAATAVHLLPGQACGRATEARIQSLGRGDRLPELGPGPELLAAHRVLGCVPLLLHHAQGADLLVYRRIRVRGLAAAQLVYVHSHAVLQRHRVALARHLWGAGFGLMVCDSRVAGPNRWHTWYRPRDLWFARGACFADRTDFLGSERCLFGV